MFKIINTLKSKIKESQNRTAIPKDHPLNYTYPLLLNINVIKSFGVRR